MPPSCSSPRLLVPLLLPLLLPVTGFGCATPSIEKERELGRQIAYQARAQHRFIHDTIIREYVTQIGRNVLQVAGPQPFEYHFEVVEDPDVNAFAGPAGWIYINTGTILEAANVSELAGVIAHEIGHVAERHVAENYARLRGANVAHQVGVAAASIFGLGGLANVVGGWGLLMTINSFGRAAELEADEFAVWILPRAGYDPSGLITFFQTMLLSGGPQSGGFLSNHPATEDRIAATVAVIRAIPPADKPRVNDGGRLEIIQRRIQILTGQRGRTVTLP